MKASTVELAEDKREPDRPVGHLDLYGKYVIFTADGRGFYGNSYEEAESRWHFATGGDSDAGIARKGTRKP